MTSLCLAIQFEFYGRCVSLERETLLRGLAVVFLVIARESQIPVECRPGDPERLADVVNPQAAVLVQAFDSLDARIGAGDRVPRVVDRGPEL